jgi:hypothetical protein
MLDEEFANTRILRAREIGASMGRSAASWIFDGNTPTETYRACVRMNEEGDPAWDDSFSARPPLAAEYGDDMTLGELARELELEEDSDIFPDVCQELEDSYYSAFHDAVISTARAMLEGEELA